MTKRIFFISIIIQVICWGIVFGIFAQASNSVEARVLVQAALTPEPFLGPIYYGNHDILNVIDHDKPLASTGEDGNDIILHYNGVSYNATPMPDNGFGYDEHAGVDYDLKYEPILASADGTVAVAGWHHPGNHRGGFGLYIQLDHGTYSTLYAHLSALSVKTGEPIVADLINRNGIIGISGNTGAVFGGCLDVGNDPNCGEHLHFEVREGLGYKPIDPYGWQVTPAPSATPMVDPWSVDPNGAVSYPLWENPPAVWNTTDQYPGGTPVTELSVSDHHLIEMDDSDPVYFKTSTNNCWSSGSTPGGINGGYKEAEVEIVDVNNPPLPNCYARWLLDPTIAAPAGEYDVYVHIPDGASALHTFYEIFHSGKYDEAVVVQAAYVDNDEHDAWAYIGHYDFRLNGHPSYTGSMEYVQVTNQTLDDNIAPGTVVVADAIRLYPAGQPLDLERAISLSSDDAGDPNQRWAGYCAPESNQLNEIYLGHCEDGSPTISGFRFDNVTIPEDTSIADARLEFTVDTSLDNVIDLQFQGELVNDADTFIGSSYPSQRSPLTNAVVPWHIANDGGWLVGNIQTSPDLSTIIQEIIEQPGWEDGNAIAIIVQPLSVGTAPRRVFGWERNGDSLQTAKLQLWYEEPTTPTPTPIPTITPTASPTPSSSVPAPTGLTAVYISNIPQPSTSKLPESATGLKPVPGHVRLSWQSGNYPAGTTFNIYRHTEYPVPVDAAHRIANGVGNTLYIDFSGRVGNWYVITAVTPDGISPPSNHARAYRYCPDC